VRCPSCDVPLAPKAAKTKAISYAACAASQVGVKKVTKIGDCYHCAGQGVRRITRAWKAIYSKVA
jgi:hypothetical protein